MRYVVVSEYDGFEWIYERYGVHARDFEYAVNALLDMGWELSGGVSSIGTQSRAYHIQAMTLKESGDE